MVEISLFGLVFDSDINTFFFQFVVPILSFIALIYTIKNYHKNDGKRRLQIKKPYEYPPNPKDCFTNRKLEQEKVINSLNEKANIIVLQGFPGIGKTELSAMICSKLNNKYSIFWSKINQNEIDKFDKIINGFAKFLNDKKLNKYIEHSANPDDIIDYIISLLNSRSITILGRIFPVRIFSSSKKYLIFIDDYHWVDSNDYKIQALLSKFRDELKNTKVIITTRERPEFIRTEDIIHGKVKIYNLEQFDISTTKEYCEKNGYSPSLEELNKINKKTGGIPLFLSLYLPSDKSSKKIIEEMPKKEEENKENYIMEEVFPTLLQTRRKLWKHCQHLEPQLMLKLYMTLLEM